MDSRFDRSDELENLNKTVSKIAQRQFRLILDRQMNIPNFSLKEKSHDFGPLFARFARSATLLQENFIRGFLEKQRQRDNLHMSDIFEMNLKIFYTDKYRGQIDFQILRFFRFQPILFIFE